MSLTQMIITQTLSADVEFEEQIVEDMVAEAALEAMNRDLEEQGLPHRIVRSDLKIQMHCSSQGDFRGASVSVNKEIK